MAVAIARPAVATTVGRPRRSGAASSTSSWTSVAEWISSTATAARSTPSWLGSAFSPAARKTSSGRRRLPPAADRRAGVGGQELAVRGRERLQPLLEAGHQRRHVGATGLDEGEHLLGAAHGTVPTCSAMIPPAVRIQRTSSSPAAASLAASASGPGNRFTELGR